MNLYRHQWRMCYEHLGSQSYSKPIPTNALWTHLHPLLSRVHRLAFGATQLVELSILITYLCSNIPRSSANQFKLRFRKGDSKKSLISRSITSAPQLVSFQSKWMAFKLDEESSLIFPSHKVPPSMMVSRKNMAHLSMKLSTMQYNWLPKRVREQC